MLFTTLALRFKIGAVAASVALASAIAASPASAGSGDKYWPQRHTTDDRSAASQPGQARPQRGRARGAVPTTRRTMPVQQPAPTYKGQRLNHGNGVRNVAPTPPPPKLKGSGNTPLRDRQRARPAPSQTPQLAIRGGTPGIIRQLFRAAPSPAGKHRPSSPDPAYKPTPTPGRPAGSWPRYGGGKAHDRGHHDHAKGDERYLYGGKGHGGHRDDGKGHSGRHDDHRHHKHKHRHHETHVVHHHVQRHYYYRTSSREYRYTNYYPQPYPYPVYYLVPYHVHATPGYHNHGEQTTYCEDGYTQGGVYRGGAYTRGGSHQTGGAIIGSIIGAAAGYQVGNGKGQLVAVGVGTLLGALIGSDIGHAMDRQDQAYATGSFGHAMESVPSCTTITWNNPQTGNYGSVTPIHTYEPEPDRYCREFQQQVVIGGKLQDAYGTACRQPDGSWEIVAEQP